MAIRAHVRYSRMLSADDCWTMLNLKSTAEITEFLKGTSAYEKPLETTISATAHRNDLEKALRSALLEEAGIFMSKLNAGARRKFFMDWMSWFETEHLKNIFRWMKTGHIDKSELIKIPGSDIVYEDLLKCTSYSELLDALRPTKYYRPLKDEFRKLTGHEADSLFGLETALDHFVEAQVMYDLADLNEEERALLTPLFGSRIDLTNLYTLHRCKWYYNMLTEEILSMLIPASWKVKPKDIKIMANAPSRDERYVYFKEHFPVYGQLFDMTRHKPDRELQLETLIRRYNYFEAQKLFKKGPPGFHTCVSYFMLKLHEIEDIVRIVEDVRYKHDPHVAAKYLIRPIEGRGFGWQS